jgi:hypothetical protein
MFKFYRSKREIVIAELTNKDFIISDIQDALDLIAESGQHECRTLIISAKNLDERFFDLKTGLAGDILQKFSNYRVRLAIIGDFTGYKSKNLQDFIRESNRGGFILFCDDVNSAIKRFESRNDF